MSPLMAISCRKLSGRLKVHYVSGESSEVEFRAGNLVACEGSFDGFMRKSRALPVANYEWQETMPEKERAWLTIFA